VTQRVLEPAERTAEVLFGLIMVLTFTGSLSVAEAGRGDVRAMLIGALGCNLAWGIIDGILYLMGALAERSRSLAVYSGVRDAPDVAHAQTLMATFYPVVASVLQPEELERIRARLRQLPPPERARLTASDWKGALGVCLLVFLSIGPVALPFLITEDATRALRASNAVAVAMLFGAGVAYGRAIGRHPYVVGVSMVLLGVVLVAVTIALGG
jgi:VIT1/CCC1 family predicted Fe2+/Mn2+ transporter